MNVELEPGEALVVGFAETDGLITIYYDVDQSGTLVVRSDTPDSQGRSGVLYEERNVPARDAAPHDFEGVNLGPDRDDETGAKRPFEYLLVLDDLVVDRITTMGGVSVPLRHWGHLLHRDDISVWAKVDGNK